LVAGLVVVGGCGFLVLSRVRKKRQSAPLQAPIAVNPQILDYVKKARTNGMTDAQIKSSLAQSGWSAKDIEVALKSA
jgi:hypothetical protein